MKSGMQTWFFAGFVALSSALSAVAAEPAASGGKNDRAVPAYSSQGDEGVYRGKRLFNSYCFLCHGATGRGNGVLAEKLNIVGKVADLTRPKYGEMKVEDLQKIIAGYNRGAESMMPKWGQVLKDDDLQSIARYVKTLNPRFSLINGKRVYSNTCAGCHGVDGRGNGPLVQSLKVAGRVPDLTSNKYRNMSEEQLGKVAAAYSAKESVVPKWDAVLTADQFHDVMSYIKNFGVTELFVYGDPARGRDIFRLNCIACHGESGKGDGVLATMLNVKMVDYTSKSQLDISDEALVHIISLGAGQYMPRWLGELNADQIRDVAAYVRTLYRPAGPNDRAAPRGTPSTSRESGAAGSR